MMSEERQEEERMAKVENNPIVRGLSGSIGDAVFRQMPGGETWVSGKPDFSHRKFSPKQKNHQGRFREATVYAHAAKTNPVYVQLAAGTVKSSYNWALSDWWKPPVIHSVERMDGKVRVNATDNVMVARVQITILDDVGSVIEKGEAQKVEGSEWWEYEVSSAEYQVSSARCRVMAEAWDLAGNVTMMENG